MEVNAFLAASQFSQQTELRRGLLIAFYMQQTAGEDTFSVKQISDWLVSLGYARPNSARLQANLKKSKMFVAAGKDRFRIHPATCEALLGEFPNVATKSEEVVALDSVVPESLLQKDRTYIKLLMRQINASYENNIFDGCAVLMRRLVEILLIVAYEHLGEDAAIRDAAGDFVPLNAIMDNAKGNAKLRLSRNSRDSLETFRELGNFSAHKIYYNAKRSSIESNILSFRALVEELLYKGGLRT